MSPSDESPRSGCSPSRSWQCAEVERRETRTTSAATRDRSLMASSQSNRKRHIVRPAELLMRRDRIVKHERFPSHADPGGIAGGDIGDPTAENHPLCGPVLDSAPGSRGIPGLFVQIEGENQVSGCPVREADLMDLGKRLARDADLRRVQVLHRGPGAHAPYRLHEDSAVDRDRSRGAVALDAGGVIVQREAEPRM